MSTWTRDTTHQRPCIYQSADRRYLIVPVTGSTLWDVSECDANGHWTLWGEPFATVADAKTAVENEITKRAGVSPTEGPDVADGGEGNG